MSVMKIRGAEDITSALKQIPELLEKKVVRSALRAGGNVVLKKARARAMSNPTFDTGLLYQSLGLGERKKSRRGGIVIALGVRKGFRRTVTRKGAKKASIANPANYFHLVEFGTRNMPAEPILRPAIDTGGGAAITAILNSVARGLARETAHLAAGRKSFTSGRSI